jgi:poly-gamma-glutamate synthesis protein (capsule biosynthesis protein)
MAVGDVMLGRSVGERIESAFGGVASTLLSADLVAANLECAISDLGKAEPKAYVFRAPLTAPEVLAQSGVDVVTLANNHAGDFGFDALLDTQARLSAAGILAVGAGRNAAEAHTPVVVERNGVRIAFLAYVDVLPETRSGFDTRVWIAGADTSGVAWAYPAEIVNDVTQAKTQADVVIVLLHFGLEGRAEVALAQRTAARAAIEAGAALVIGAHPHLLQSVERHKNGLIAYSLGNFVFDQFTPPQTYAAIFAATLTPQGVQEYNWIPVVIEDGLPRLATADEAQKILPMVAEAKLP